MSRSFSVWLPGVFKKLMVPRKEVNAETERAASIVQEDVISQELLDTFREKSRKSLSNKNCSFYDWWSVAKELTSDSALEQAHKIFMHEAHIVFRTNPGLVVCRMHECSERLRKASKELCAEKKEGMLRFQKRTKDWAKHFHNLSPDDYQVHLLILKYASRSLERNQGWKQVAKRKRYAKLLIRSAIRFFDSSGFDATKIDGVLKQLVMAHGIVDSFKHKKSIMKLFEQSIIEVYARTTKQKPLIAMLARALSCGDEMPCLSVFPDPTLSVKARDVLKILYPSSRALDKPDLFRIKKFRQIKQRSCIPERELW